MPADPYWCSSCRERFEDDGEHLQTCPCAYALDHDPNLTHRQRHPEDWTEVTPGTWRYLPRIEQ